MIIDNQKSGVLYVRWASFQVINMFVELPTLDDRFPREIILCQAYYELVGMSDAGYCIDQQSCGYLAKCGDPVFLLGPLRYLDLHCIMRFEQNTLVLFWQDKKKSFRASNVDWGIFHA